MVGPNGLEPSTSSVSRKRSNQTELRAYMGTTVISILRAAGNSGNVCKAITGRIERDDQEPPHARYAPQGISQKSYHAVWRLA